MKVFQSKFTKSKGWENGSEDKLNPELYNLILAFGSNELIREPEIYDTIRRTYPNDIVIMSSTAGEISDTYVNDNSISLTAVYFEKTKLAASSIQITAFKDSYGAGQDLSGKLDPMGLKHVFVISDGQKVNGSELVDGLRKNLPYGVAITGGLAGDGSDFKITRVGLNEIPVEGRIAVIGFYGDNLIAGFGSVGGWDSFGPERLITKSNANILYELDGKPALDIYKMYLGEYANELPSSGLLFPLSIRSESSNGQIVRTILGVNEKENSLTFAGNIKEGSYARLMKANFDRLIEGAGLAAQNSQNNCSSQPQLAILISCVGRKLVLNQRIEEEVEIIREVFGPVTAITGFYSYGEISPSINDSSCELHNQTMTITTFSET
jgi:hypothetical protein